MHSCPRTALAHPALAPHCLLTPSPPPPPQVASFLRYELYDPETLANGGCILRSDPVPDQAAEASLLAAVELLYRSKVLPAALEHISSDQVGQSRPGGGVLLLLLLLLLAAL